jgi:hypothetical protein
VHNPTLAAGVVPPALAALSLAFTVNLFGSLTHYASGQVRGGGVDGGCMKGVGGGRPGGGGEGWMGRFVWSVLCGGGCLALVGGDSQGRLGSGEGGLITLVALHCTHPF